MKKKNPMLRLWELGADEHGRLIKAIILAFIGVLGGMIPYFCATKIVIGLIQRETEMSFYLLWCLVGLIGFTIREVLYNLALGESHKAAFSILKTIRQKVLEKLPKMPLGTVIDTSSGQIKQMIVDQVESMETSLAHVFPEMTSNIVVPILIFIYLFVLDWRMALLSIVSIPVGIFVMGYAMKDYSNKYEGAVKTTKRMNETIVEYIRGIKVIKAFNQGASSYEKYEDHVNANASYYYNWMKSCQLPISIANVIMPTTMITILPGGWLLYNAGHISIETFIITIILSLGITEPLIKAMNFIDSLAKVGTTVESVDAILQGEEQEHGSENVVIKNQDIILDNVSFGYHEDKEILHHVNLSMKSGDMVALVGPSGSGKSTIAKLIAGFWDVTSGKITLGGIDEKDIPLKQLYDQVAFVSQDNYLFDTTIKENIRMGNQNATDNEVIKVAKAAGCDSFIKTLENGYDTVVGGGGAHLSGGEKQRIAIARAMLKDSPIVILDEATAYIDPENEAIIQKAVSKLINGKTVIIIAHRLSTIIDADQIVVVNHGQIKAEGTHETLLEDCELYKSMWEAHVGAKDGEAA